MPDKVADRCDHSINAVGVCDNSIWVIVSGGVVGAGYQDITLFELGEERNSRNSPFLSENFHVIIYYTKKFWHLPLDENYL